MWTVCTPITKFESKSSVFTAIELTGPATVGMQVAVLSALARTVWRFRIPIHRRRMKWLTPRRISIGS